MITVSVNVLKAKLSEYINLAIEKHEVITITNRNIPVAEIKMIKKPKKIKRKFGLYKENVKFSDDFHEMTPELEEMFFKSL